MSEEFYSPPDFEQMHREHGAMCGHGALAAALGVRVRDIMQKFHLHRWVSIPAMEAAIRNAGVEPGRMIGWDDGRRMVTLIQWHGPWMAAPPRVRCCYRHWIASWKRRVWDVNSGRWQSREEWEREIVPAILPARATGWTPFRSIMLFLPS